MKILICAQDYYPKRCGVAKVVEEWARYLASCEHDVTVATSGILRNSEIINGIVIVRFVISGSLVRGLKGNIEEYQNFVINGNWDIVIIYAAEQWAFDSLLPVLNKIKAKKVHAPCGYASMGKRSFKNYYEQMTSYLKEFDLLIYHSNEYRDIEFARKSGLDNLVIIPNGASSVEFLNHPGRNIKKKLGVNNDDFVFLSVGSPPMLKGHLELIKIYQDLDLGKKSVLVLNGRYDYSVSVKNIIKRVLGRSDRRIKTYAELINKKNDHKKVIILDLPREDLVSLFFESDLFVLASKVECSPLVLFEAVAAGLPYVSKAVGNAKEISGWLGGGIVGDDISKCMEDCFNNIKHMKGNSENARKIWAKDFTWESIGMKIVTALRDIM